jgi:hypothetical protein
MLKYAHNVGIGTCTCTWVSLSPTHPSNSQLLSYQHVCISRLIFNIKHLQWHFCTEICFWPDSAKKVIINSLVIRCKTLHFCPAKA